MSRSTAKLIAELDAQIQAQREVNEEYGMYDSPILAALVAQRDALRRVDRRRGKVKVSR